MANIVLPLVNILSKVNDNTNVLIEQDGAIQRVNVNKIAEIEDSTKLFVTIDTQTMISSHSSIEIYAAIQAGKTVIISEQGAVYTVSEISEDKISIFIELTEFEILFYDIDINKTVTLKNTITTAAIPYSGSTTNGNILSVVDEKPTWTKFAGGIAVQTEAPENTNVLWVDTDDNSDDGFQEAVNYVLAQAKASGEFDGLPGEKGDPGLVWKGEYDGRYADREGYCINDVVYHYGSAYVCIENNASPIDFPDGWELLVSKGKDGDSYNLTDDDKQEMVNIILAALPVYNGEVE